MARPFEDEGFEALEIFERKFDVLGLRVFDDFGNGAFGDFRETFERVFNEYDEAQKRQRHDAEE